MLVLNYLIEKEEGVMIKGYTKDAVDQLEDIEGESEKGGKQKV